MTWKFQIRHFLLGKNLWSFVGGSETIAEDASPQDRAAFGKKSQKVLLAIVMAVSPSQLYLITCCDSPKEAWDTLKSYFERDMLANKLLLKKSIFAWR